MVSDSGVGDELRGLDVVDLLIILSIGRGRLRHLQVQKIAAVLSRVLGFSGLDVEAYRYGVFSETVMEKLESGRLREFVVKRNGGYELTDKGLKVYMLLLERLKARGLKDLPVILEVLQKLSDKELLAIQYFLFPEYTVESEIKWQVDKLIKKYKKIGEAIVKAKDTGEEKIVEIA